MRPSVRFAVNHLRRNPHIKVVEIGVNYGLHALELIEAFGDDLQTLHLIDPYLGEDSLGFDYDRARMKEMEGNIKGHPKTCFLRRTSVEAACILKYNKFDFVYLDGDHSFADVIQDCFLWWPLIADGGIMAGHDYKMLQEVEDGVMAFARLTSAPGDAIMINYQVDGDDWWIINRPLP